MKKLTLFFSFLAFLTPLVLDADRGRGDCQLSFGVVADIQYADKETSGRRRYPESIVRLTACIDDWNSRDLAFAVQLGDIIDGNSTESKTNRDLDRVLAVIDNLKVEIHHVIGNHCLAVNRDSLLRRLNLREAYYDFSRSGWRFIVLDGMDISVQGWPEDSPNYRKARAYLKANPEAASYNGAVGKVQLGWLEQRLESASQAGEKAIVFCHHPVLEVTGNSSLLLWNHGEILEILERHPCAAAFLSGHHHAGSYAYHNSIHHLTLQGMIEAPPGGNAYGTVHLYSDSLVVEGAGDMESRTLRLIPSCGKDPAPGKRKP